MTAHRYVTIWCDCKGTGMQCGMHFETWYSHHADARSNAKQHGWQYRFAVSGTCGTPNIRRDYAPGHAP